MINKCVVLLSGGLDSSTTLFYAKSKKYEPVCLIFDYGQRHKKEIRSAVKIAKIAKCPYFVVRTSLPWKGSALLNSKMQIPNHMTSDHRSLSSILSTYVPARNIIFLSYAVSLAEVVGAKYIFYGANQIDYSGYPDCRKPFIKSFQKMAFLGTKYGSERKKFEIIAPLVNMSKEKIVKLAVKLKVPLKYTWSCYQGGPKPCGKCDSCYYRAIGFHSAGIKDPLLK